MCLLADCIANNQLPGLSEAAPHQCTCSGKFDDSSQAFIEQGHVRSVFTNEDDDDSRDRQAHWKRMKTLSADIPGASAGNTIRLMGRNHHAYGSSLVAKRNSHSSDSLTHAHRMVMKMSSVLDEDTDWQRSSYGSHDLEGRSRNKGWDMSMRSDRDGGTAGNEIDPRAGKRKHDASSAEGRRITPDRSPVVVYGRNMVSREKHMARRLPVDKATGGCGIRVSGKELGEFNGEDQTPFLEDSGHTADDCREQPRISVDLRESLNRRRDFLGTVCRDNRSYADLKRGQQNGVRGFDAKVRGEKGDVRESFGCGKVSSTATLGSVIKVSACRPSHDDVKEFQTPRIGAAALSAKLEGGMECEGRKEKGRTRWAEKERDLEKENMPKTETKSVAVVDYSHKFTVSKAPASVQEKPVEADPHRLCQRQKQIDYGKNTLGYERYMDVVPRYSRTKAHPRTPDIRQVCSKRSWDGQIRKWRRLLHEYDPPKGDDEEDPDQLFVPSREQDSMRGSTTDDSLMDTQSEGDKLVEDPDLKIYDGWSDDEC